RQIPGRQRQAAGLEVASGGIVESGALEDDAFDDVGDVFALVNGGLDDLENFFPLDDLDGIFFLVEELCDQGAAETVAFVFIAIDLDAVFEGRIGRFDRVDGGRDFYARGKQNPGELH